ncbi:MAG: hypothetical protein ACD_55C00094G0008 [uncultured bacterium]|uniref:Uncharacterized protein n=1 Tax=Citrifermentans bemidjiense (strain ATCC BAA-1014 / DSM 16622 / JCM 12645 / Bem) TaxID=404380 RepID=B5EC17_CITBB|nr:hypothetical protein [Citrifermentans bemidjiense]ACH40473.1 hypothetical protein Gbem_3480 [Citrifermentans bemidjiense Bem]EKD59272.1 MAG: hypothetical protein ACD_55C00094G0008 [uncultured bacterium]
MARVMGGKTKKLFALVEQMDTVGRLWFANKIIEHEGLSGAFEQRPDLKRECFEFRDELRAKLQAEQGVTHA